MGPKTDLNIISILCLAVFIMFSSANAQPQIISAIPQDCFKTGTTGTLSVTVMNTGDFESTFSVGGSCSGQASIETGMLYNMKAGEERTLNLDVVGSTAQATENIACTVSAVDSGGIKDSKDATVCVNGIIFCTPNERGCGVNENGVLTLVYQCNSAGTGSSVVEDCSTRGADWRCSEGTCILEKHDFISQITSNGWFQLFAMEGPLFAIGLLIIVLAIKYGGKTKPKEEVKIEEKTPLQKLKESLAEGRITRDDYTKRKKLLED